MSNKERAEAAFRLLIKIPGWKSEDLETLMSDHINNMMHLAVEHNIDFDAVVQRAADHFYHEHTCPDDLEIGSRVIRGEMTQEQADRYFETGELPK